MIDIDVIPTKKSGEIVQWEVVEHEYITTSSSYNDLAERYNIPLRAVVARARLGKWQAKLKDFYNNVQEEIDSNMAAKAKEIADRATVLDLEVLAVSEQIIHAIGDQVDKIEQGDSDPITVENMRELVKTLKYASDTVKTSHQNIRLAISAPTAITEEKHTFQIPEYDKERIAREFSIVTRRSTE